MSVETYQRMQFKLLPVGVLWNYLSDTFKSLLEAIAEEAARLDDLGQVMLLQAHPSTATEDSLLPEWETLALLPDELPTGGETEGQRQQVVQAKITTSGQSPNKDFFTRIALSLGMTITIADVFDGIDNAMVARVDEARVDDDRVSAEGDIFHWEITVVDDPDSQLTKFQTMVARLKPDHTTVTYL